MKSLATNNTHYPLEQILSKAPQRKNARSFRSEVTEIWQAIVAYLECTSEPRVWQTHDQARRDEWNAYDPASHQTLRQVSAQDLRVWLEERHYQYNFSGDRTVRVKQLCNLL
jgi:hypothetical protein